MNNKTWSFGPLWFCRCKNFEIFDYLCLMKQIDLLNAYGLFSDYQNQREDSAEMFISLSEELSRFITESPYKPPFDGCILDIIGGISEPLTSKIIRAIFSYRDCATQKPIILESFLHTFISKDLLLLNPRIEAETSHFDVSILDKAFALVIENKLKDATFQRNQLARYLKRLNSQYGYDESQIYLVILPQFTYKKPRLSAGRLPEDLQLPNGSRKCIVAQHECWCDFPLHEYTSEQLEWCKNCDKTIFERSQERVYTLHNEFAEWLLEIAETLPQKEMPIKSCMIQFADYIKGLYSTRFNNKLKMAITDFLKEKILNGISAESDWQAIDETLKDLDQLRDAVNGLRAPVSIEFIKEWEKELIADYPEIKHNFQGGVYSFGLLINGVWIGCWSGTGTNNSNKPYWGFWCKDKPGEKQVEMVKSILKACDINTEVQDKEGFMIWGNTLHGDIRCRGFFEAAKAKGY